MHLLIFLDVDFSVNQFNTTHAKVEIQPSCNNGMNMLQGVDLNYCTEEDCVKVPSVTVSCLKVSTSSEQYMQNL